MREIDGVPFGKVVSTGIRAGGDERVLYAVALDPTPPGATGSTFAIVAGRRSMSGNVTGEYMTTETAKADGIAGFHAIELGDSSEFAPRYQSPAMPIFGYFVGPAARIVATRNGKRIDAELAHWSENPGVVIFWFDPDLLPAPQANLQIDAFDADGLAL
jgi:hypothetical protein